MKIVHSWTIGLCIFLVGCNGLSSSNPTPIPTVVLGNGITATTSEIKDQTSGSIGSASSVSASGVIVARQQAVLASSLGTKVEQIDVDVNEQVNEGQVLVVLAGGEEAQAALSAAKLELLNAEQALDQLNENAALAAAEAQKQLAQAQEDYDDAKHTRDNMGYRRGSDEQIAAANANYILAQDKVDDLQDIYDNTLDRSEDDPVRALALANLENAKKARDKAKVNLNWYKGQATDLELAQADADLAIAAATLDQAQVEWNKVKDGPDPAQVDLIEAQQQSAKDQVNSAEASLADLQITAPFTGTIMAIQTHVGEWVTQGQAVIVIADLNQLQVQTTDLSERDVPLVEFGQTATVTIDALNQQFNASVITVSPLADTLGGDVVYQVTLDLDENPSGALPGMSVEVSFD